MIQNNTQTRQLHTKAPCFSAADCREPPSSSQTHEHRKSHRSHRAHHHATQQDYRLNHPQHHLQRYQIQCHSRRRLHGPQPHLPRADEPLALHAPQAQHDRRHDSHRIPHFMVRRQAVAIVVDGDVAVGCYSWDSDAAASALDTEQDPREFRNHVKGVRRRAGNGTRSVGVEGIWVVAFIFVYAKGIRAPIRYDLHHQAH